MKLSVISILFLFIQVTTLEANEIDIDEQIAKIEKAPEVEKPRLIYELKQKIVQMNVNQQTKAITKYQQENLKIQITEEEKYKIQDQTPAEKTWIKKIKSFFVKEPKNK